MSRLPDGFAVRLRDDLLVADGGAVLVGGSPTRVARLSGTARQYVGDGVVVVRDDPSAALARRLLDGDLADPLLYAVHEVGALTVVVPVRDRVEQLDRCLASLDGLAVVVVDDASADPSGVAAVAARHGATLLALNENLGPAGARNAGLEMVTTELVAFVDSDVTVDADRLGRLARHFEDPQVSLAGPRVVGTSRSARPRWFERYDAVASSLDLGSVGGSVRPGAAIGWLPSACLVGRVADLGRGFEGAWRVAEDVDLVWRLVERGRVVRYDPSVEVQHDIRRTVRAWLGRKFAYGTGGADLAARHGDKVAPAALSVPMAVAAACLLHRRAWSVGVALGVVAATSRSLRPRLAIEDGTTQIATRLAVRGLGWAVRQESGLLLRHWWPAAAVGAVLSRTVRRCLLTAVAVDLAVFLQERPGAGVLTAAVARRLDDAAYGSGLWWGAIARRDPRCLAVRRVRPVRRARR